MSAHPAGPRHAEVVPAHPIGFPPDDLNALDPRIWPRTAGRSSNGMLQIGGIDIKTLIADYGTPLFLLDEADFRARARSYQAAFAQADVFYAGKAFLSRALARWVNEEGLGLDVCTGYELATALAAHFPPQRIALHGNNKSETELWEALHAGVGRIVVDSDEEITRLIRIAAGLRVRPRVLIRVTVGVEAHTHEFIATAHEDQKFGFSLSTGAAAAAVNRVLKEPNLELVGLHSHIGSQIFDTAGFEVAAHRMVGLLAHIQAEHGVQLAELDLGGGLGIAYTADDDPADPKEFATGLAAIVERECATAGLMMPRLAVEPGRALIGPAGITVYEIGTIKPVPITADLTRTYVSVDGGMSDNIRTALYDATYTAVLANRASTAPPMPSRVVGKHCESGDVVIRDLWLPADTAPGDLLAVAATGAYCRSMASNYNMLPRPGVVAVADGASQVLVRRESLDDLLRLDVSE